jgi:hypothetical protein
VNLPSTDAVLAAQDVQHAGIDAEEVEIQPVRGVCQIAPDMAECKILNGDRK